MANWKRDIGSRFGSKTNFHIGYVTCGNQFENGTARAGTIPFRVNSIFSIHNEATVGIRNSAR